jgi:hypothetical protein
MKETFTMLTDRTRVPLNRLVRCMILSGLAALTLAASAPGADATTLPPPADTAPPPAQEVVDKRPDLIIQRVEFLSSTTTGYDKTRAFVFVLNQGLSRAKPCTLTLLSWSAATGFVQSTAPIPALAPGALVEVTINTPIGVLEPGTSHHFTADGFNVVVESNEFNNTYDFNNP